MFNCKRTEALPTILGIKTGVTTKHKNRERWIRGIRDGARGGFHLLEKLLDVGGDGLGLGDPRHVLNVSRVQRGEDEGYVRSVALDNVASLVHEELPIHTTSVNPNSSS